MPVSILPVLLVALQTAPVVRTNSPPPPVVVGSTRVPAPVLVATMPPSPQDQAKLQAIPHRIDLKLSAGGETIWQGPLRVSLRMAAQVNYSKNEAATPLCIEDLSSYHQLQSGVSIGVRSMGDQSQPNRYMLDIKWTRPAEDRSCGVTGTRAVDVDQIVLLPVGQTVTVHGDGGLVIQATRRD